MLCLIYIYVYIYIHCTSICIHIIYVYMYEYIYIYVFLYACIILKKKKQRSIHIVGTYAYSGDVCVWTVRYRSAQWEMPSHSAWLRRAQVHRHLPVDFRTPSHRCWDDYRPVMGILCEYIRAKSSVHGDAMGLLGG